MFASPLLAQLVAAAYGIVIACLLLGVVALCVPRLRYKSVAAQMEKKAKKKKR
jgi:hypothetical protein